MGNLPLSDEDRAQLSARADDFYAALIRGKVTDWGQYLAGLPDRIRRPVLAELVIIDLSHRWANGERPVVEDYLERFPELGPAGRVPAALILEEHRCRIRAGERPDPVSFQARFPDQYPVISGEVEAGRGGTIVGSDGATISTDDAPAVRDRTPGAGSDYEFLRALGRGVFGEVWLARKRASGIEKAVKILHQAEDHETADRERGALELIKNLRHPYLLATDDFWVADNRLHVAMELADCTLRDELRRCREAGLPGIPPNDLLGYMWEAAEGLDFLHSRRIIHRDVKPDNVMLLHGHAKVGDFGLARYQDEVPAPGRAFAGTPAYMSPEAWGRAGGPASDQYSLAVTYAELRQGTAPLHPRPIQDMLLAHAEGAFEFSDALGPGERAVVLRALSSEPENRYPSCRAFVEALTAELKYTGVPRPSGVYTQGATGAPSPTGVGSGFGSLPVVIQSGTFEADEEDAPPPAPPPRPTRRHLVAGLLGLAVAGAGFAVWRLAGGEAGTGQPDYSHVWRPPGTVPPENPKVVSLPDGRELFAWVQANVGGAVVRFRLIVPAEGPRELRPFYIMESKVWSGLYGAAGADTPADADRDVPVTGVSRPEAAAFARRVFGGRLPTPEEWDYAAGLYSHAEGRQVTVPGGEPWVNRDRPRATRGPSAGNDLNVFDLRDMGGNGREWTAGDLTVPGEPAELLAITRGHSFTSPAGLTFDDLRRQAADPPTQRPDHPSPYTSFRVVLPAE